MGIPGILSYAELKDLLEEASMGKFAAGIFWETNPAYSFPEESLWEKAIAKIPERFRIGLYGDETALGCDWRLPEHHWLESWGDFESSADYVSLRQPIMGSLHDTRQGEDLLLACMRGMGESVPRNYLEFMKEYWRANVYPAGSPVPSGDSFESQCGSVVGEG